ncbi:MAG: PAS domain S-box protein [Desulfobacteraceae bacterium]
MDQKTFYKVVDSLPEHIAVLDNNGIIVYVNQAWKNFAQENHLASNNYCIGVSYFDLCNKTMGAERDQALYVASQLNDLLTGKIDGFSIEYPCHSPQSHRWFRLNLTGFMVDNRPWAVAAHENITLRSRAERELRRLSRAVEYSPVSVVITDVDGVIEYVNPKFEQVTGYTRDEVIGRDPGFLSTGNQPANFYKNLWDTIKSGQVWQGEFDNVKKNGEIYWESASISPIFNEQKEIISFVAIKEDITARKEMIQDLKQAKIRAEAGVKAKNEFLATISHEIRTPMNTILGMSQLALDADLSPDQRRRITHIQSAGKSLMNIINDILGFARHHNGNSIIKKEVFQFGDIMEKVITANKSAAEEKNLELSYAFSHELPVYMEGDRVRLTQIIMKLTENALKYTSSGEVTISSAIRFQDDQNLQLNITIADTGIGMTEDQLAILFEPFTQANGSSARTYGGTGLGLAIVKQMTDAMNGSIQVKSTPGEGSVFTVSLPFTLASSNTVSAVPVETPPDVRGETIPAESAIEKTSADKKILIVDDNPANREIVAAFIENPGIDISEAGSGTEALEQTSSVQFHLIFMDLEMPGMDGFDTTREIRKLSDSRASNVPIIAVTGYDPGKIKDKCLDAGMNDFLTKPVNRERLAKILDKWLDRMQISENSSRGASDIIDMKAGLAYVDNKKTLYMKMLKKFTKTYAQADKTFAAALKEKDIQFMKFSAHNLSSIGTMIGAVTLGESARTLLPRLNNETLNNNFDLLHQEVISFCALIKKVVAAAFSLLNTIESINPEVEKHMHSLLDLIQKHQPAECRDMISRLKSYDISQAFRDQLTAVESLINRYRFRDAEKKWALFVSSHGGGHKNDV